MTENNDLKIIIKNSFEKIIQYYIDRGELHQKAAADVRSFAAYLEGQTDYTRKRLAEVIEKINYETIERSEEHKVWPDLEFWRDVDDFGSSVALNYDGGVDKKFHTIDELSELAKTTISKDPNYLWIGELEDSRMIGIFIGDQEEHFGKIVLAEKGMIEICDYSFEKSAKYAQRAPKQPELFAAEENDAAFLKKRLSEGWDYDTSYSYQRALTQAAGHNSHEALIVLLEAGAKWTRGNYRAAGYMYDEKTMEILDEYQED